jgi:lipid-binding SYLF domain-containing protein
LDVAKRAMAKGDIIMEKTIPDKKIFELKRALIAALMALIVSWPGFSQIVLAKSAREIDASVNAAIQRFYLQVKGAKEFVKASKAMLVMPNVIKGAFIIGGEYGEGALRIGGKSVDYYNTISGSIGFQIGGQAKDIILLFMTDEALEQFRASEGWEAGVDGNIALINFGAGERIDTRTQKDPIVGFVFDAKGLIADISLKGAKFSRIDK